MNYLMKKILVVAVLLSYAIPVTANIKLAVKDSLELISTDMSMENHCHDCDPDEKEDCCEDDCQICLNCCSLFLRSTEEINDIKSLVLKFNTHYSPLKIESHPRNLIRPPIV